MKFIRIIYEKFKCNDTKLYRLYCKSYYVSKWKKIIKITYSKLFFPNIRIIIFYQKQIY